MTEEERTATQKVVRVGINLGVLLDIGLFAGQHSNGISECKDLVKGIVAEAQQRLSALQPPPPPPPAAAPAPTLTPPVA
jgi:hypothetical protein